jgi:hypothetical protein
MTNPNDQQVGGNHYKSAFQHWDFVRETNQGYLEGGTTKYLGRSHKKNGVQDLNKALHYVDKLTEDVMLNARRTAWQNIPFVERVWVRMFSLQPFGRCKAWRDMLQMDCLEFVEANEIDCPHVTAAIMLVVTWGELDEHPLDTLRRARLEIELAIKAETDQNRP